MSENSSLQAPVDPVAKNCCKRILYALDGPAKCLEVTSDGMFLIRLSNGIRHRISYCPFCGTSLKSWMENTVFPELSEQDSLIVAKLALYGTVADVLAEIGPPDWELQTEDGEARQLTFYTALSTGVLIILERPGEPLEIGAIPHATQVIFP